MNSDQHNPVPLTVVGWREWVELPGLGVRRIKAKVDTGARSSSLHVSNIEHVQVDGRPHVRFRVHPFQRRPERYKTVQAPVLDIREVRSSSGEASARPVIVTPIQMFGQQWDVELTLADRSAMGFRMLLGREAIRGRFLVDAGGSFFAGVPARKSKPVRSPGESGGATA